MCCRGLSKFYLVALNFVTAVLGIAVIGVAAYTLIEYADINAVLSKTATYGVLCAGIVLFLFSLFGCCAARSQNRCALMIYVLALLTIGAAQIIAGAVIANYAGELNLSYNTTNLDILSDDVQDFVTCSYGWCCDNEEARGSCNKNLWANDGFCKVLPANLKSPSSTCDDPGTYNEAIVQWIRDNERTLAIAALSLGGVELIAVVFGVYLLCASKPKTPEQIEQEQRLKAQNAGSLAYGSAQPVAGGAVRYAV